MVKLEQASVRVSFPEGSQYGNALYKLRKTVKGLIEAEVHKEQGGVLIVCEKSQLGSVLQLLTSNLEGYSVVDVQE